MSETTELRSEQGFDVYVLRSETLEVAVIPELGSRIVSLKNLRSGREWMWHPEDGLKLFRNRPGDDFSRSTLAGADECLPTIAPCSVRGRQLPDHGEVWSAAWQVDDRAWHAGLLRTRISLAVLPFEFERTIEVRANEVRLSYMLKNRSPIAESFLWALHPLLRVHAGDRLRLPSSTRSLLNGESWLEAVDSGMPNGACAKLFAAPVKEGLAEVWNGLTGDCLLLEWNPQENDTLGLWLTRGGWHGHHHLAVEPTNGAPDPLASAVDQNRCGTVAGHGSKAWSLCFRLEPAL